MKVRCDVFIGEKNYFDVSFLEKRKAWLPKTGIYLEFILKGIYDKKIDFAIESKGDGVSVSQHSWNRFFLNIQDTAEVVFKASMDGRTFIERPVLFNVSFIPVPLVFSVLSLFDYSVRDIRFFANRISENMVNSTRFVLCSPRRLEKWAKDDYKADIPTRTKLYDLLFSILTERGVNVFVTLFDSRVPYTPELLQTLKPIIFDFVKNTQKFRVIWDLGSGLKKKHLGGLIDSILQKFGRDVLLMTPVSFVDRVGGEGYSFLAKDVNLKSTFSQNERGVKIARLSKKSLIDFYTLRKFTQRTVKAGWGVEYIYPNPGKDLRNLKYSLSRALYQGYLDSCK